MTKNYKIEHRPDFNWAGHWIIYKRFGEWFSPIISKSSLQSATAFVEAEEAKEADARAAKPSLSRAILRLIGR